jgi:hypothetical protein
MTNTSHNSSNIHVTCKQERCEFRTYINMLLMCVSHTCVTSKNIWEKQFKWGKNLFRLEVCIRLAGSISLGLMWARISWWWEHVACSLLVRKECAETSLGKYTASKDMPLVTCFFNNLFHQWINPLIRSEPSWSSHHSVTRFTSWVPSLKHINLLGDNSFQNHSSITLRRVSEISVVFCLLAWDYTSGPFFSDHRSFLLNSPILIENAAFSVSWIHGKSMKLMNLKVAELFTCTGFFQVLECVHRVIHFYAVCKSTIFRDNLLKSWFHWFLCSLIYGNLRVAKSILGSC